MKRLHPALTTAADAAYEAFHRARRTFKRHELEADSGIGADGTTSMFLDKFVEGAVVQAVDGMKVNLLSEELGWVDNSSAITLIIDPVDGTANAAAGVPIACFSGAIAVDGEFTQGLTRWLANRHDWAAADGETVAGGPMRTTGRKQLHGAHVSLLRPQPLNREPWWRVTEQAARVRVFSCSTFESALVFNGAIDAFADPGGDIHRLVDLAAAIPLSEAAGAVVRDAEDRSIELNTDLSRRWSGIVAASSALAEELQAAIQG